MGMGFSMNVSDAEEIKKEVVEEVKPSSEEVNKLKKLSYYEYKYGFFI